MRIAVNTRLLLKNRLEGIGWFTYETLRRITQQHPEHEFIFIFDRKFDDSFVFSDNITPVVAAPQARHPVLFYLWFEHAIPWVLKKVSADLFLSPDGYMSLASKTKSLVVMHDLNFEYYPKDIPFLARRHYLYYFPRYARKADRIATVSEYSKNDIVSRYKVDPGKIDVVFNGANERFRPISDDEKVQTRNKYSQGKKYFVFIGALHPRKNLVNLFKAFDLFKDQDQNGVKLIIVGEKMYWTPEIKEAYENLKNRDEVIFTGRLDLTELRNVLGSALALTYVSYFEGFGIPIVESFNCNVPVITSNVTSMPEIAGDAALLVDPFSVDSICEALKKVSSDEKLRKSLVEKGTLRAKTFSWQKSAERLWDSIDQLMM